LHKLAQLTFEASEPAVSLLSDFLLGMGSKGVAEDIKKDDMYEISAYFPIDTDLAPVIGSLKEYSAFLETNISGAKIGPVTAHHIDRSSWEVWKKLLTKVRVGKRIIIRPPWEEHTPRNNEIVIEINPSLAFGTGHHESTRLCIESIKEIVEQNGVRSMLDVGCGSGILSISAVMLGVKNVTGLDIDPIAIKESEKNAQKNSVFDEINFFCGYIEDAEGQYELIVANVYIEPILMMREEFKSRLALDGRLVVAGIPDSRRDEAVRGLEKSGFILDKELKKGGWVALWFHYR